jgi:branched-chain amino acid transport system substrate-binding protein
MSGVFRRALVLSVVLAAFAALTVSCTSSASPDAISIGMLYPTSGSQGVPGRQEERGAQLAMEWVNAHGGVHGRPIRLVSAPADRAEAVPSAMDALHRDGIAIAVGSHGSAISAAAAKAATRDGMLFWETGAVGETTQPGIANGRNFFRAAPMGANLGRAAVTFIRDEVTPRLGPHGPLRYGVAYIDDVYGSAVGGGAVEEINRSGQVFVGSFPYPADTTDFTALAARIAASHPDVLFVSAYVNDGVALRKAFVAAHVPFVASIGTSSSYCMPEFGKRLGIDAVGLFASDKPDANVLRPSALEPAARRMFTWANDRYRARYGASMSAPALSGFSNAYALFGRVLPRAHAIVPSSVGAAAVATKLPLGALPNGGGLDLAPAGAPDAGENRNAISVIEEWVAPNKMAVVWPRAFATHSIDPITPAR